MDHAAAKPLIEHLLCVGHATPLTEVPLPAEPRAAARASSGPLLLSARFAPSLLSSYPPERPFPPGASAACSFCLPAGLRLAVGRRPPPSFGCFALTDDSYSRLYGHTLTFYVALPPDTAVVGRPPPAAAVPWTPPRSSRASGASAGSCAGNLSEVTFLVGNGPPSTRGSAAAPGTSRDGGDGLGAGERSEVLRKLYSEEHYVSLGATPEQVLGANPHYVWPAMMQAERPRANPPIGGGARTLQFDTYAPATCLQWKISCAASSSAGCQIMRCNKKDIGANAGRRLVL